MSQYPSGNPARMGRRVWARVVDSTVIVLVSVGVQAAAVAAVLGVATAELFVLILVVMVGGTGLGLWTLFARAALPGQWLLGLHHVDAVTGARAGGRTFLKYLIQGCTFGLALIITPLTIQAPNRSWFDRLVGVTLVDPKEPDPVPPVPTQVAAPPLGWNADESHLTQLGHASAAQQPMVESMIQAVPFQPSRSSAAPPPLAPPPVDRPVSVAVAPPHASPVTPEASPVAPQASPVTPLTAVVTLDNGDTTTLTGTVIVGRAPKQSQAIGAATLMEVDDQSVSANHVALGTGPTGPWAMDLSSTNGSWVTQPGLSPSRLEPMVRVELSAGAVVKIGQRTLTVTPR